MPPEQLLAARTLGPDHWKAVVEVYREIPGPLPATLPGTTMSAGRQRRFTTAYQEQLRVYTEKFAQPASRATGGENQSPGHRRTVGSTP
ncbi:hypothetical protein H4687_003620 [Streptomyces stelliscabiei]|uniref:Uncharacterized protein n=1 Tax=Streptomyces stelliscabiei TaxID=146820 RepID=A0A8I0P0U1_9ACTN|nr:hypothetical protein [Streptomyces stelliscabiei]